MLRYFLPLGSLFAVVVATPLRGADEPDPKKHWAFKAPVRSAVPKATPWVRNPIDAFVLQRLESEKLTASPEADKITLCRRLYLDLIGLPPTPKEVDEFVNDKAADAYEKLVEKLLASPHHGERWARWWLDAARFADSDGYEKDMSRQVWAYREWVIKSLNADMPYSQFVTEQLAGDQLPNATQDQSVATGFLRMSMLNEEGGVDPEQFRMDAMFDRMDAVGKAFLGLSVACCQCHDHKFDPISQEEYYRLFAYLNNDHESERVVYTPAEQMAINGIRERVREIEMKLMEANPTWQKRIAEWEAKLSPPPQWKTAPVENAGDNSQRYIPQKDGSILAQGYAPTKFSTLMRGPSPVKQITAFRIELLNDPNLPCNGPGRSAIGTSALTEFMVEVESAKEPGKRVKVKFVSATADFDQPERELEKRYDDKSGKKRITGPIRFAIDGKDDTAWGIDAGPGRRNVPRNAVFVPESPLELPDGATLQFNLKQLHGGWNSDDLMNHNLGRFRLSVTDAVGKVEADSFPAHVRAALAIPAEKRSKGQTESVFNAWRLSVSEFKDTNDKIEAQLKAWPEGSTSLVAQMRGEPRETRILKRGDFLKPKEKVDAGVPAFLHQLPKDADGSRLTLAKWIVDTRSPTTARALVNRVWQSYFGNGLMTTPEEFGTQGEKPSHPELLDWLAVEFMEPSAPLRLAATPWSIKHLHRLIVTSATYRQSSRVTPELLAKDPYNRLLARGARFRADGEVVRDIALSTSGLLNPKIGGPSVFTPAPQFLFQRPVSYGPFDWTEATGDERYRRALYTFRRRSTPYPALTVFDVPIGEASCVKRTRSNTPLQALTGLNETLFVESARALGKRAILEGGTTDADRLTFAFRACVSRKPTADELAVLTGLLEKHRKRFAAGEGNAAEVATGEKEPKAKLPAELKMNDWAAFTLVARVLLNLDETVTKE
ncbi:MAG: DUF1549 and DUF1553 domain-containing protein [Planctomycetes bacterium]|nr:DUF1549 and DUF1553 domain-containing protein [Planctomycetota bacterium]